MMRTAPRRGAVAVYRDVGALLAGSADLAGGAIQEYVATFLHVAEADMGTTTINSREFNQDVGRAKRAAKEGPVIITDRGRQSHVLLSIEDYRRLTDRGPARLISVAKALGQPGPDADFAAEFARATDMPRPVDLHLD